MRYTLVILTILLTGCEKQNDRIEPETYKEPFLVSCKQPLPQFTLGQNSAPSDTEVSELCSCIYENLGDWERETAQLISEGKDDQISFMNKGGFGPRFGAAIEKCGGMEL